MNMRKIIAVLSAVLMLCSLLPLAAISVSAADENVVYSADFESGLGTWASGDATNAPVEAATPPIANPNGGSYAMKHTITNGKYPYTVDKTAITLEANTDYVMSFDTLATNAGWPVQALIGTNTWFGTMVAKSDAFSDTSATEWKTYSFEFNSGSNTKVYAGVKCTWTNTTLYFDNIKIVKKTEVEEPEGGETTETPVLSMDWNDGVLGFNAGSVVAEGPDGSNCLKWTAGGGWSATTINVSGVTKNTDFVITFKAKASENATMGITIQNAGWGSYYTEYFKPTSEWAEYTIETNVADHPTSSGGIMFKFQDQGTAMDLWIDDLVMVKKEATEPEQPENPENPDTPASDNMVVNGNFEDGLNNWSGNSGTKEIVTNDVHGGTQALKLTNPGQWGEAAVSKAITVTPGKAYVIKWWSKHVSGSDVFNMYIIGEYTSVSGQNWMSASSGWVEHTWIIKPTSNAIQLKFSTEVAGNASSILIDDVTVYEKSPITNGDFEAGTTEGWTVYNGTAVTTAAAHTGSYGLHCKGNNWAGIAYQDIPVENGKSYEFSFWYYINSTDGTGFNYKLSGTSSGTSYKAYWPNNAGEWTQVKFEFLATDDSMVRLNFSGYNGSSAPDFFIDDVQIKELKDPSNDGYIINGDFETGNGTGWGIHQSTVQVSTNAAYEGEYGLIAKGNGGWGGLLTQSFNLKPNSDYIIKYTVKAVNQGLNIQVSDDVGTEANSTANGGNGKAKNLYYTYYDTSKGTEWKKVEAVFNSGENTTATFKLVGSGIGGNGDELWFDNISIEKVGGEDPIPNNNVTGGQTSVKDATATSKGLAFRFEIAGAGAQILETNEYVSGSATIKLYKDRDDLVKLVKAGAVLTNNAAVGKGDMTLDSVDGKKTIDIPAKYLCDVDDDAFAFAVRIVDIPDSGLSTNIFARPYFIYEDEDGNEIVVYGNVKSENYNHAANPKASIKILAIGNSFSQDAMNNHLYQVLESAGYEEIVLGNLYIGGCDVDTHWTNINNDSGAYTYYYRDASTNGWRTTYNQKVSAALESVDWDYVTIQQASPKSGLPNSLGNLNNILGYIDENKTNPNAKILWHMTWAYDEVNQNSGYANYGNDQMDMYRAILDTVNSKVLSEGLIDGVIPAGTAIQNMRTSSKIKAAVLCEGDGYHLSKDYGDYIAALTWYAYVSGDDVSELTYQPDAVANCRDDINTSVNGAIANPYKVTKCASYDTQKSIKVLSIGHSFSVDVMGTYLYQMLEQAGYEDITIGYLYYPGCSLSRHWEYISTNHNGHERYGKNNSGSWVTKSNPYAIDVLRDEDWDYVTLQASPDYVGGQNNEYSYIPGIANWIHENALNANVDIKWHQIWAYSEGCDLWSYTYHNWDQMTMYNNIITATEKYIVPDDTFSGIIPVGTAVQNARAKLGDIFNMPDATQGGSDGYHLNEMYGDFLGSLTWACYFSGVDATTITERSADMTEEQFAAIAEAVNDALANPLEITE